MAHNCAKGTEGIEHQEHDRLRVRQQRSTDGDAGRRWIATDWGPPMEHDQGVVVVRQRKSKLMVNARPATRCGRGRISSFALLWCMALAACSTPPATAPTLQHQTARDEEKISVLEEQQERLLAEVQGELKRLRQGGFRDDTEKKKREELEKRLQVIETRISQETRNHYWREGRSAEPFLSYGDRLFQRVEANGIGRPPLSKGKAIYGMALLLFTIRADGTLEEVDVVEASNEEIGWHAAILLRELEPFERFSAEMSSQADGIVFARHFRFVRGDRP